MSQVRTLHRGELQAGRYPAVQVRAHEHRLQSTQAQQMIPDLALWCALALLCGAFACLLVLYVCEAASEPDDGRGD